MSTTCYATVRGSALRVTGLTNRGTLPDLITYAASKAVASVKINEVVENGSNELLRTDDDVPRIHIVKPDEVVRYSLDIDFMRCDPGILGLLLDVPPVIDYSGNIVGYDSNTRLKTKTFALEVWSKLVDQTCAPGTRKWGYTLFPVLRGGVLTGLTFANGLVSFTVTGAKTQKGAKWGVGPWDIAGPWQRLVPPVSGNTAWKTTITTLQPPAQTDGTATFSDVLDGGTPSTTTADVVDGGTPASTSDWIIDGGTP